MLYKIFHNPSHPRHSEFPNLFHPRRVTRGSLSTDSLSFSPMRFHASQYSRCFISATTKLWNELPRMIVEATELQKYKLSNNTITLGVDGLLSALCPSVFYLFLVDFLSSFIRLLVVAFWFYRCFLFFLKFPLFLLVVFPAVAFGLLVFGSPSWGLQSVMQ